MIDEDSPGPDHPNQLPISDRLMGVLDALKYLTGQLEEIRDCLNDKNSRH